MITVITGRLVHKLSPPRSHCFAFTRFQGACWGEDGANEQRCKDPPLSNHSLKAHVQRVPSVFCGSSGWDSSVGGGEMTALGGGGWLGGSLSQVQGGTSLAWKTSSTWCSSSGLVEGSQIQCA